MGRYSKNWAIALLPVWSELAESSMSVQKLYLIVKNYTKGIDRFKLCSIIIIYVIFNIVMYFYSYEKNIILFL